MLDVAELHRFALEGATLLAPNLRTARQLRGQVRAHAASPGEAADLSDRVPHWRAWTAQLWQRALLEGRDERVLLQPLQERLLWEQILDSDPGVERTDALVDLCLSGVALLYQHNAAHDLLTQRENMHSGDIARFAHWFRAFHEHCRDEQLLPSAALEDALARHAGQTAPGGADAGSTLVLCNLASLTPAQNTLLTALSIAGCHLHEARHHSIDAARPVLLRCSSDHEELQHLARHLASSLAGADRPNVAVVVPDLTSGRDRIDRVLREHLHTAASAFADDRLPLWEFSTGRPLPTAGVVADALHLLTWTERELDGSELSLLLRSPHLDWPVDAEAAASLDAALLRRHPHLRATWSPRTAAHALQKWSPALAEALAQRTRSWAGLHGGTGSFNAFAERSRHILRDFGWFRSGDRSTTGFQAVTRFEHLLDSLSSLDLVVGDLPTWASFVHRLIAAARATSFARENTAAPIQFLTPDESTGVEADETWVLHADEERWSSRATPHPLLPRQLQLRSGMPGTDAALDQARVRAEIDRIAQVAGATTFSYAHAGDTGEQRPSPAVTMLPGLELRDAASAGMVDSLHAAAELQTFQDGALIPLALTGAPIPGGVSTLQSQAACAFRAFAERRLGSATFELHDLGLDARDRGNVLHRALQIFWNEHRDRATLLRLIKEGRLDDAIHRAIDHALVHHPERLDHWSQAYLEIQRTNFLSLLRRWLHMESERPDFRVLTTETGRTVTVGPIPITVRIDRIDEVTDANGGRARVILDYKTGTPKAKKWEGERPDEPQLPLYATSLVSEADGSSNGEGEEGGAPVGAIAFGVVRSGDTLSFITAPKNTAWLNPGPKASTATLESELEGWRTTLATLAEDFAAGTATVGPKEYPATCRFCDQRLLCRLNPALLDAEDDPESEA